jgi:hypothetical protein
MIKAPNSAHRILAALQPIWLRPAEANHAPPIELHGASEADCRVSAFSIVETPRCGRTRQPWLGRVSDRSGALYA